MLGKSEGKRKWGWQRMKRLDSIFNSVDTDLNKLWEMEKNREAWHAEAHGIEKSQTRLSD